MKSSGLVSCSLRRNSGSSILVLVDFRVELYWKKVSFRLWEPMLNLKQYISQLLVVSIDHGVLLLKNNISPF